MTNDSLNIEDRDGIDAGKGFVEKHELRLCSERTCNFDAPPFTTGKALSERFADVTDV